MNRAPLDRCGIGSSRVQSTPPKQGKWHARLRTTARVAIPTEDVTSTMHCSLPSVYADRITLDVNSGVEAGFTEDDLVVHHEDVDCRQVERTLT